MAKQEIVLGGGCFWCLEAVFELLDGVENVVSGYANGAMENPDYRSVCSGDTGHAEVVRITYVDSVVTADDLLEIFFEIHDPTTLNQQGADTGTQYRSTILYDSDSIKEKALQARDQAQKNYQDPIVTIIEPLDIFYTAEAYHQDYYRQNTMQGYCMAVISPKVAKLKEKFSKKVKK